MFNVENGVITLSIGDTGAIRFNVTARYRGTETPYTFSERDRAVFSIKNGNGIVVKEKVSEIVDGKFVVTFYNSDTDSLQAGTYSWDTRYIINPFYNSAGKITDGDQVITPELPQNVQLLQVVGDI